METHDQIRDSAMDHYRNVPMHFAEIFSGKNCKKSFRKKNDCGYVLEPPHKANLYFIKVGYKGVLIAWTC